MRRFLINVACFGCVQLLILVALLYDISRRSNEYLAASIDKERSLRTAPGRRIVFVGGSNLAFGIDSLAIGRRLGLSPVNMGLHAGLGLQFMFRETRTGLRPGDLVVLSLEYEHFSKFRLSDHHRVLWQELFANNVSSLCYASWQNSWIGLLDNPNGFGFFRKVARLWYGSKLDAANAYRRELFNQVGDLTFPRLHNPRLVPNIAKLEAPGDHLAAQKAGELVRSFVDDCRAVGVDVVCV